MEIWIYGRVVVVLYVRGVLLVVSAPAIIHALCSARL